ncbi:MAG: alpha/beta fold hydrolase, partial [Nodosilinea sp.]
MPPFVPPWFLQNGLAMTLYTALVANRSWSENLDLAPISYREQVFKGHGNIPIFGCWAIPPQPRGTIIATYGITGSLDDQWQLEILGRKAYHRGYGLVLFDWRAHGKTAELSPTLTSDGLYEGHDYIALAAQAKALGCAPPFWLMGYSLSGQLALWGAKAAMDLPSDSGLVPGDIGGVVVVCPSLDSNRSLQHLTADPLGKYLA